jgi:hypothetical protein
MRNKIFNKIIITTTAIAALAITGCKKSDFAINDDQFNITETTVDFKTVLPSSLVNTSSIVATSFTTYQKWMGYWARSGSFQNIVDEESYQLTSDFGTNIWDNLYINISNYDVIQQKAAATGAGVYEGIARIMKAHNFGILVDFYGNIPYKDALKGLNGLTPKYDKGEDIYKDLFKQLDTAIAVMNDPIKGSALNNIELAKFDIAYAGNKASWIKIANTIKLRLLVHASRVTGFPIAAEVAKMPTTSAGYLGAGETFQVNPGFATTKPNPYYRAYVTTETGAAAGAAASVRANAYATGNGTSGGYYNYNADPRVGRFYSAGALGLRGLPYGFVAGTAPDYETGNTASINSTGLTPTAATSRAWIMTGVESLFLQAEAAAVSILPAGSFNVSALTNAGITESFVWLGLTPAAASAYITGNAGYVDVDILAPGSQPGTAYPIAPGAGTPNAASKSVYTIVSQKWFALNGIAPFEVYSDYRRWNVRYGIETGYTEGPSLSIFPGKPASVNSIPNRLLYPQSEYNFNAANVGAQGLVNAFTSRVFWDIN